MSYDLTKEVSDKYSLQGRVFHKIREDILNGKYKSGDSIKEVVVSKELGVSRTPVREALKQLELEGLVISIPNKGTVVAGITEQDIIDIYAIRSLIEGLAARWAAIRISEEQLKQLEEIINDIEKSMDSKPVQQKTKQQKVQEPVDEAARAKELFATA
ncbi:MAG TPA: GntR family transcriptional regulator, partial [Defluviitaleaceae bacterium]|nr:GntR family transcriptional regulator [Defluviitaleaceae bacterium]